MREARLHLRLTDSGAHMPYVKMEKGRNLTWFRQVIKIYKNERICRVRLWLAFRHGLCPRFDIFV